VHRSLLQQNTQATACVPACMLLLGLQLLACSHVRETIPRQKQRRAAAPLVPKLSFRCYNTLHITTNAGATAMPAPNQPSSPTVCVCARHTKTCCSTVTAELHPGVIHCKYCHKHSCNQPHHPAHNALRLCAIQQATPTPKTGPPQPTPPPCYSCMLPTQPQQCTTTLTHTLSACPPHQQAKAISEWTACLPQQGPMGHSISQLSVQSTASHFFCKSSALRAESAATLSATAAAAAMAGSCFTVPSAAPAYVPGSAGTCAQSHG
jgi:hypothetical protein